MSTFPNRRLAESARWFVPHVTLTLLLALVSAGLWAQEPDDASNEAATDEVETDEALPERISEEISEEITVTANRVETSTRDVGSSVTVLTARDIERHAWPTVADALRSVPGLEVSRSGGPGQVTSVFVRGGSSSQTLVLLDGVRLNSATTGAFDFADLSTDAVARIEVVRGPQSTLYGSEAAAGVVSIVTCSAAASGPIAVSGRIEGGADDRRFALSADGRIDRFDYRLSVSDQESDGTSAADVRRGHGEIDAWDNTTASARLGWSLGTGGEMGRVDVDLRRVDSRVEIDGFAFPDGPVDDVDAVNRRDALYGGVTLRLTPTDRFTQTFQVGVADDELSGEDPTNPFGTFVIDSQSVQASSQSDLRIGSGTTTEQLASFGVEWQSRDGGTVGSFDEDVEIASFFVHDRIDRGPLHLSLGARYDDHSQFGAETTWRVSAAVDVGASSRVHGSWGTGFKAPTLNDLFFPGFSNPELVPETSEGVDLGFEHRFGERWRFDVTGFDLEFEDLIAFDFVTFLPQNIASATSRGVELQVGYGGERFDVSASHTWNETEDEATGRQLARRPEDRSVLDLSWRVTDRWRLASLLTAVADRIDSDGTELEDYERVDLTVEFAASERLRPYVRVVNLFDEEYSEIGGFGGRGATALAGVRLTR